MIAGAVQFLYLTDKGDFNYMKHNPEAALMEEAGSYKREKNSITFYPDDDAAEIRSAEIVGDTIILKAEDHKGPFFIKGVDLNLVIPQNQ